MSDATISDPPRSSAALAAETDIRSDSSSGDGELDKSGSDDTKGEVIEGFEGKGDSKQRRKRTRYVMFACLIHPCTCFLFISTVIASYILIYMYLQFTQGNIANCIT